MTLRGEQPKTTLTQPPTGFTVRDAITTAVIVMILAVCVWLKVAVDIGGTVVSGEVVGKRESIEMPLSDTWRHVFEISYRYQPLGARHPSTGRHAVDVALYDRLHVGSPVNVRYTNLALGLDSALADSSWWSRRPHESESARELAELIAVAIGVLLGVVAYRRHSRTLTVVAVIAIASVAASVMMLGFVVFPALFWLWRGRRGQGFGWALLCSAALSAVALYYRVPWPSSLSGPQGHATAIVRSVHTVDQIWASSSSAGESSSGQWIRRPFQMVDLEFTPAGRTEPVHSLDRVDLGSIPGLQPALTIPVIYPLDDPRAGRMSAGTRDYARQIFLYMLGLTFGLGALIALIVGPAIFGLARLAERVAHSIPGLNLIFDAAARERSLSALPPDDRRRQTIERLFQQPDASGEEEPNRRSR